MNYKQFPQFPKEMVKSDIGICIFESSVLADEQEMCSHNVEDLFFVLGASCAIPLTHVFFNFDITDKDQ